MITIAKMFGVFSILMLASMIMYRKYSNNDVGFVDIMAIPGILIMAYVLFQDMRRTWGR